MASITKNKQNRQKQQQNKQKQGKDKTNNGNNKREPQYNHLTFSNEFQQADLTSLYSAHEYEVFPFSRKNKRTGKNLRTLESFKLNKEEIRAEDYERMTFILHCFFLFLAVYKPRDDGWFTEYQGSNSDVNSARGVYVIGDVRIVYTELLYQTEHER